MKQKITRLLSIILPLALGVFLIIYSYNQFTPQQLNDVFSHFKNADYTYIYISLFIGLSSHMSRAYHWKYTLEHMGYKTPFGLRFFAVCIANFMNMTIPRSGEVARALVVKERRDVPLDEGIGTIVSERVIDLIIMLFCTSVAVLLQFGTLKDYLVKQIPLDKLLIYGLTGLAFFIAAVLMFLYSRMQWVQKLKLKISGFTKGVLSVFKMRNKWPFLLHSAYIWTSYVLMFYVTIYSLPETAGLSFGVVAIAFVVGSFAVTFSNGGFGVYPIAVGAILKLYGIPAEAGTAFGWIVWASQTIMVVLLGCLSFLLLPLLYRKK
ncbi:hypothetical protein AM493_15450 [Flavobacterium akiainvivens]|uniref:TIGR00374 family protein n=1 Tax=Flavobacterium akiainvivens TaxID=1202724 RepID=A0A0M9VJ18_9FLAO|nr:lysylphosphatidylglycerol synthase transmembrane domain-containing protein [Flavobacterium akiainvivens]KOS07276.1 hypothetical protein AM493_15450 [Flavobacterium akiainvivens]SFQ46081.1 hypothetical protein SAMN05444144_10572 [Flavobacterium akiainvivens]